MAKKYSRVSRHLRHIGSMVILVRAHIRKNPRYKENEMRKRKEIEEDFIDKPTSCSDRGIDIIKIELLLDIRDLLLEEKHKAISKALSKKFSS